MAVKSDKIANFVRSLISLILLGFLFIGICNVAWWGKNPNATFQEESGIELRLMG
jgi:hypothetical protein